MVSTQRYCTKCGAANAPDTVSCFACGVSLKITMPLLPQTDEPSDYIALHVLFKGRFRILSQVGSGGFGAVYKAEDTQGHNRLVAIKEIQLSGLSPTQMIDATDAFNREVQILSGLKHPTIPRIYEHFTDAENWYLVMDFIEGETLAEYQAKVKGGKLAVALVLEIGMQLCDTLDYLHSRKPPVVFRDLKPANIMLAPDGRLYLIDFGVARYFKPGKAKDTIAFGSPGFAAPEQYGRAQTTPKSDIYSLGATLHNLLTGDDPAASPFAFAAVRESCPAAPAELETLITRMLEMDAEARPESIAQVRESLQHIVTRHTSPSAQSPLVRKPFVLGQPQMPFSTLGVTVYIHRKHNSAVRSVAWSPDGQRIASASEDRTVQVWDGLSGKHAFTYRNHAGMVYTAAWSPDGQYLASAGGDQSVQVWEANSNLLWLRALAFQLGFNFHSYAGHGSTVYAVSWSSDGKFLASASADHCVKIWDVRSKKTLLTYSGHSSTVLTVAWSPDGQCIASSSVDRWVRVWDVLKGENVFPHQKYTHPVHALAWSPDGKRIALEDGGVVLIWDFASKRKLTTLKGHRGSVYGLAWSPDGKFLASAGKDKTVQIWETASGKHIYTYEAHAGEVRSVAWSPDGHYIASANDNGTVDVWKAD